jgi:malate dehydrogenase (quinone)
MLDIVENCFIAKNFKSKRKLKKIFPSYGIQLNKNPSLLKKIRDQYQKILKLR